MAILTLGVSFRRASIELLERLAFTDDDLAKSYRFAADLDGIRGAIILSTCNRVEVYGDVSSYHAGFLSLKRLLTETRHVAAEELTEPLYSHWERDAAEHLFAVASGLDSMVLGETQILDQVRDALRRAAAEGAESPELAELFHSAKRAGLRVRKDTSLGTAPDAFVTLGIDLAGAAVGSLAGRDVVVVGAGTMAALAVKHLRERGAGTVRILNRSVEHARSLARSAGVEHDDLEALPVALRRADVVVGATGAAGTVIHRSAVAQAVAERGSRPLVLLDLAVPRDVEPESARIEGVEVIDIVALGETLSERNESPVGDVARGYEIVADEVRRYVVRRRGDELSQLIRAVRRRGDEIARVEMQHFSSRLAGLSIDERDAVESLTRRITAKLLHDPIVALKERSEPGVEGAHARMLAELLGIDEVDETAGEGTSGRS